MSGDTMGVMVAGCAAACAAALFAAVGTNLLLNEASLGACHWSINHEVFYPRPTLTHLQGMSSSIRSLPDRRHHPHRWLPPAEPDRWAHAVGLSASRL